MDTTGLRAAAARLAGLHGRFAPCFGRRECQEHALGYLQGLLLGVGRKSVEPMALVFGGPSGVETRTKESVVLAWQRFLTVSPWEARAVQREIQAVFNEEFLPTASEWPIGTVGFDWVTADEEFGRDGAFLDAWEQSQQRYLLEIPSDTTVWTTRPLRQTPDAFVRQVRHLAAWLPAGSWETIKLREGAKGPLAFEFARLRVWSVRHRHAGPPLWLLVRRSLERVPEVKYYLSNAQPDTPLRTMAQVTGVRWRVEEFFQDAKGNWGWPSTRPAPGRAGTIT